MLKRRLVSPIPKRYEPSSEGFIRMLKIDLQKTEADIENIKTLGYK